MKPITTLFMLTSVDGKISTGVSEILDVDRDFPEIDGLKEGLHQYYEIEQTTDLWTLNSGRVQAKLGVNEKPLPNKRNDINFVLIDNHHLTQHGVAYFTHFANQIIILTTNPNHSSLNMKEDNLHTLYFENFDIHAMLEILNKKFGCERLTIQTGGTLNGMFLREKVFDYVDIVIAPVLIGGHDTSTLIDGTSLLHPKELTQLGVLRLESVETLQHSYIRLRYQVIS